MLIPCLFRGAGEGIEGKMGRFFFFYESRSCQLHGLVGINLKDQSHDQLKSERSPFFSWKGWSCASLESGLAILWPCGEGDLTESFPCLSPSPSTCLVIETVLHEWNIWWYQSFTIGLNQSKPISFRFQKKSHVNHLIIGMEWLESLSLCFRTYFTLWFLLPQVSIPRELRDLPLVF